MNYTEKFHLPQWDETDRILRTDFNQMCRDMEAGLAGNAGEADALRQDGRKTMDRFRRMAYNHYCMVQSMNPAPDQIGLFYQNFEKDPSGVTGTQLLNGVHFAGKSEAALSRDIIRENMRTLTNVKIVKGNLAASTPFTADFTPPASGQTANFILRGNYSDNTPGSVIRFRLTLTNQETGSLEWDREITAVLDSTGAGMVNQLLRDATTAFIGGVHYLITLQPLNALCNMDACFMMGDSGSIYPLSSEGIVSANRTIHEPEGGLGGIVIVRCGIHGAGGKLTFSWDGVERKPVISRLAPVGGGKVFQEYIYLRDDPIPADSDLSLRFVCEMEGSFQFYDWGAMLF